MDFTCVSVACEEGGGGRRTADEIPPRFLPSSAYFASNYNCFSLEIVYNEGKRDAADSELVEKNIEREEENESG